MKNKKTAGNYQSSIVLCQPSCGYYFSSGLVVSETVYSSAEHGAIYNAASRVIIDGGRKVLQTAALGGMLAQNFTLPAYAGNSSGVLVFSGQSRTVSAGDTWTSTTIYFDGRLQVSSGGTANSTIVDSGGYLRISSGGRALNISQAIGGVLSANVKGGDTQTLVSGINENGAFSLSGGIASNFVLYKDGHLYLSSGGIANNTTVNSGGKLWIYYDGGTANSTEVNDRGIFCIYYGGTANSTTVNSGGILEVYGTANSTTVNSYGSLFVLGAGATTNGTTVNSGGIFIVSNDGTVNSTTVNSDGYFGVYSGVANSTRVNSAGVLSVESGGSAINIIQEIGGVLSVDVTGTTYITGTNQYGLSFSLVSGIASNFVINSYGGYIGIDSGGKAYRTIVNIEGEENVYSSGSAISTVVNPGGLQYIEDGGTAINTIINSNGSQVILSGGLSISATINSGGKQYIESAGVASDTTINVGGWQYISAGGSAVNNIVGSGGSMVVYNSGVVSNTVVESGGSQIVSSGGSAGGMIISGTQYVSSGAVDTAATVVAGGYQNVLSGGIANNATLMIGGNQTISSGGLANNTVINSWGFQTVCNGGMANSTTVNSAGILSVSSGGSATNIIQHSGGQLIFDIASGNTTYITGINERGSSFSVINGVASNVIVNNKGVYLHDGGILYNYIATSNGNAPFGAGGSAINVIQETGGDVSVDVGIGYDDKDDYIGTTYITGTNQYGQSFSLVSGVASNFVINEHGYLDIYSGGKAYGTIINSGYSAGQKEEPGMTVYSGGSAISTVVKSGGSQLIEEGGYAIYTTVSSGGKQTVESGGIAISNFIYAGGIQNVEPGAIVQNAVISGGGSNSSGASIQVVSSGATASNTIIGANAVQQINDGGLAISAVISSGGEQNILSGGGALGTVIYNGGTQKIGSSGYASGTVISQGGAMELASGGFAAGLTVKGGGTARISGTNTLYGDNELQNGGSISLVRTDVSAPAVLTFENLYGNGTIDMGIDFSNPAESDKIVISGIHNGNTVLNIKTIKGGKPVNDDSLKVVDCSGATETGTFSLKGGKLDTGWYEYTLDRDIQDYYLRSNGEMTNVAKTAIAAPAMGNVSINVALNSLQKRLGDLRTMGNGSAQHGTWARGYYQSLTLKEKIETEMKISGIEAGYDFRLSEEGSYNGEGTYLGIMAGKSSVSGIEGKGRTGRQESKGEGEGVLGGAYLTYIGESGFFADFTARAGTNKLDLSAYSESEGGWLQFSPERTFIAASMEAGKSFGGSGWKIEPKAEMRYMNIGGADAEVKGQPEKIKFSGASYITAIGTLNAAYSWKRADGMITQPYAEVSYSQELSGEEEIKYSGNMDKSSMKGGFIEGRIGINMQMSDNLYWHAAAGIESGSRREGFGADAGIRYMFGGHKQAKRQTDNYWKDKDKTGTKAVSAEKKADDKAITALPAKPATVLLKAVNAEPGNNVVTTEKEEYLEKAGRAEKTISKEVLKIPPMGLLFQIGKMAILSYYTPMLDAFAKLYLLTDQSSIIYVEGFSSNGGNETKNNPNLSKERAMNVAYYLMSKGIKGNKILVKPYGNSKIGSGMFANDSGCSGGGCYRRVNISIK
ncbi:MAG: AIDA repeat-containing protein [Elusimicrobiales bacterium]|nr:AIDA repeat-containing protein [Elusimicrobiales bacterium]